MNSVTVFIVDDHRLVREGFISIINDFKEFELIGEAENGQSALDKIATLTKLPDVILMDINMPKMNGVECTQKLIGKYPDVKIIALTMMNQSTHIKSMLKSGAVGYILKDCDQDELREAIQTVAEGNTYFSQSVSQQVMNELTLSKKQVKNAHELLSEREKEVLRLIVKDLSNKEIADQLYISVRTVDTHKQNLLSKTGTNSTAGLVVFAIKNELVNVYE